jgi:hypothetical protein
LGYFFSLHLSEKRGRVHHRSITAGFRKIMISIDFDALNPLEKQIHEQMIRHSKTMPTIRINQAAAACHCSVSKISKFVKKLGFSNYKQYLEFLYGKDIKPIDGSNELNRVHEQKTDIRRTGSPGPGTGECP